MKSYLSAKEIALQLSDKELIHRCAANLSLVLIELGEYKQAEQGLREIIISSQNDKTIFGAAYSLAISLRKQGKYLKSQKYAQMALRKGIVLDDKNLQAKVHNLLGNIYLYQTYIDSAMEEYMKALELRKQEMSDNRFSLAILQENIGYCHMLKKKYETGIALIKEALKLAASIGDKRCMADCYQDICYALLLLRKLTLAEKAGEQALKLSCANGYLDIEKNCYYLLGEINFLKGSVDKMDGYFQKLQEYYPHLPFLKEFLSRFDVSEIITLKQ